MKLSKLTIIKLLMVHLVTTALTKAHYDGYRGTFKCTNSNTREEKAHEQVSSSQPVESTTVMTTAAKSCTKMNQTTNAQGSSVEVFQRRVNGSVDFYRNWTSYKEGFGDPCHEFWLGNDKLSHLTNQGDYEIRIDMVNKYGNPYYAKYDLFRVNDESDNYRLSGLGAYTGTADTDHRLDEAGLEYHRHRAFSTYDRDNDNNNAGNCAVTYQGAWWYGHCHRSNLNGNYTAVDNNPDHGKRGVSISWRYLPGNYHHIKYTEMKIRPVEI
ncbi:ficolin-2-like isoform X3 [Apostichopus japonicus]|uniref:ficolin-2-like isoform X3 n=1 Tax=Stichopus japonicus TaxID=307972 RepID=UPI003AB3B0C4